VLRQVSRKWAWLIMTRMVLNKFNLSFCLSVCLSVLILTLVDKESIFLLLLSVLLPVCLSYFPSVCLVCLFVCLFVYVPVCLFVCLSIWDLNMLEAVLCHCNEFVCSKLSVIYGRCGWWNVTSMSAAKPLNFEPCFCRPTCLCICLFVSLSLCQLLTD